jgi:hypothetical protein
MIDMENSPRIGFIRNRVDDAPQSERVRKRDVVLTFLVMFFGYAIWLAPDGQTRGDMALVALGTVFLAYLGQMVLPERVGRNDRIDTQPSGAARASPLWDRDLDG